MIAVYIVSGIALVGVIALLSARLVRSHKRKSGVDEIKGVRYTTSDQTIQPKGIDEDVDAKISYNTKDILIPAKKEMIVGKYGDLKPGKYTILTTAEDKTTFNIRLGGYVRVYTHNSEIILAEGDKIKQLNIGIILSKLWKKKMEN